MTAYEVCGPRIRACAWPTCCSTPSAIPQNRRRRDLIDLIFLENNEVHNWLVARGEDPRRLRLVKSGVDLAALRPMTRSAALEQQIGAAPGDLIVGFSGHGGPRKKILLALWRSLGWLTPHYRSASSSPEPEICAQPLSTPSGRPASRKVD